MSNMSVFGVVSCNCPQHFTFGSLYTSHNSFLAILYNIFVINSVITNINGIHDFLAMLLQITAPKMESFGFWQALGFWGGL